MRKLKLTVLLLMAATLITSCEKESDFESLDSKDSISKQKAKAALDISSFNGTHIVYECVANESKEEISFKMRENESGEQELFTFDGQGAPTLATFSENASGELSYTTSNYNIVGRLVNNAPVFDVTYRDRNFCSNPPSVSTLFQFSGLQTVTPCNGLGDSVTFRIGVGEIGIPDLDSFDNQSYFISYFNIKEGNVIEIARDNFKITGKLIGSSPVFDVIYNDINYCSTSLVGIKSSNGIIIF